MKKKITQDYQLSDIKIRRTCLFKLHPDSGGWSD
jgi:hypothetical protein